MISHGTNYTNCQEIKFYRKWFRKEILREGSAWKIIWLIKFGYEANLKTYKCINYTTDWNEILGNYSFTVSIIILT